MQQICRDFSRLFMNMDGAGFMHEKVTGHNKKNSPRPQ